ncbi:MAG: hypothetical protein EBR01_14915, partial [Proteobacteria bacterium]|nr:hypothetical protein [Pseudomonadota bacterium]
MSETELRRQSRYTWMLIAFTAIMFVLMAHQSRAQNFNWDGDNAAGNFLYSNNWYGESIPSFSFSGNLVFNYINNAAQTSQYYDFAGWANASDIIWESTLQRAATLNGNGQGINFNQRLENRSSYTVTIGSNMNLSGAKNGATQIELNPVNGDMTINGTIFNNTANAGGGANY